MRKLQLQEEKGSAVIILALAMTVLLGFTALVTDVGLLYLTNVQLSNAVDAAVLAGAQELPHNPELALQQAEDYALANGVEKEKISLEVFNDNKAIKAQANKEVEFFFARVLGFNSGQVAHGATALVGNMVAVNGAVPLGIQEHNFQFGEQYTLKVGAGDTDILNEEVSPGWFGVLALEGPGAKLYEDNLTYGFNGELKIGDILDVQTGNISNPTKRAIDYRMAQCTHSPYCTVDDYSRDCPKLLKVPVIEPAGHKQVRIKGFAMFLVEEVPGQGNENFVKGRFLETVTTGEIGTGSGFGLMGVKLVQ